MNIMPEFVYPHHVYYAWTIVAFMVLAPFVPFVCGWRLGERVPMTVKRFFLWFGVLALPLILMGMGCGSEPTFGDLIFALLYMPVIAPMVLSGEAWILFVMLALLLLYALLMTRFDRYIVRKRDK